MPNPPPDEIAPKIEDEEISHGTPELNLLAAIVTRAVQDYASPTASEEGRCNEKSAMQYLYSMKSVHEPYSFRWALSFLCDDVEWLRRQIIDKCESIRLANTNNQMQPGNRVVYWRGAFWERKFRWKNKEKHEN